MKKYFLLAIILYCVLPAWAQSVVQRYERFLTTPRSYVAHKLTGPIKIDGVLDEKDWENASWTAPFEDISGKGFATPKYKTTAKILWDDDYVYIGAELEEPDIQAHLTQRDTIIYYDNDFEIFIDPEGDGKDYFEIELNARNVVFDLMLDRPYRVGGEFFTQWNCPGMKSAVHLKGTLNFSKDQDRGWTVEVAIPRQAVSMSFDNPLKAGKCWRIDFSRVEWLKKGGPEENWVWSATGAINMHMPERWGYVYCSDVPHETNFSYPVDQGIYKLMWAMYYAQADQLAKKGSYDLTVSDFHLSADDLALLPQGAQLSMDASPSIYNIKVEVPARKVRYLLDSYGFFRTERMK